jgi:23S rRNA (adenine2503-C2)-methyltransferase
VAEPAFEGCGKALPMLALQAVAPARLVSHVPGLALAEARRIVAAIHRGQPLSARIEQVRKTSLAAVRAAGWVPELETVGERASEIDPFVKLALGTADGEVIETVRIPLEKPGRFSVCVSSQVGCALGCAFCATGRMGLRRNLESWEIVEQVRIVRRGLVASGLGRVRGVVFQGMGEPMANLDRVLEAIEVFCDPSALAIDARAITVCTSGLPAGIRRLAREAPKVRLGLSIGSARPAVRRSLMPIDRAHSLDEVLEAAVEHARATGLAPMWAVTPLATVNDLDDDARALGERARAFAEAAGVRPRISVIPYNPIAASEDPFHRADDEREARFRAVLAAQGFPTHKRYSGGADVRAACGQLAGLVE